MLDLIRFSTGRYGFIGTNDKKLMEPFVTPASAARGART